MHSYVPRESRDMKSGESLSIASSEKDPILQTLHLHTSRTMSRARQPMSNSLQTNTETFRDSSIARVPATLRLRAEQAPTNTREATSSSRRIRWSEDVVDNEGMGKKSSKGKLKYCSIST
jgi:hypothetical protein